MAENTTIREGFFDSLAKGAKWDVGVSINRTNPLPLDQYSVFKSETDLDAYIAGAFAYPGQILALVGENETVVYYLDQNKEKQEVGSMPGVDGKSIKIETDAEGNEYLTLVGLTEAKAGASLVKGADGNIGWSTTTQSELNADLTEIKGDIVNIENTLFGYTDEQTNEEIPGHEDRIDALEDKFASLGGIFNYRGAIEVDVDETISDKIDFIPVSGDVVLVNGTQEYVYAEGKWEPFGDPHGVEAIDDRVSTLENKIDGYTDNEGKKVLGLTERVEDIEDEIGVKAEGETVASGLYAYIDSKAASAQSAAETAAKNYTDEIAEDLGEAIAEKADAEGTTNALALKADITYVDGQIDLVEAAIAKKADQDATTNALNLKADNSALESGLALKADKEATNQAISGLDTRLTTAESDIDKLEAAVGADGLAGKVAALEKTDENHQTAINGLTSNLGSIGDGAEAGTAFGKAAAASALAQQGVNDAATAQAKANSAYTLADEAKTLAGTKVNQTDYDAKVAEFAGNISTNAENIAKKADTSYVNEELDKKANQSQVDGIVNTTIPAIENNIKTINETTIPAIENNIKTLTETTIPAINNNKADITYVNGQIDLVEAEIAKKADKSVVDNLVNETIPGLANTYAPKDNFETLQAKVNSETTGLDTKAAQSELNEVRGIAEAATTVEEVNAKIAELKLSETYEPIGAEQRAKDYVDDKFTDANLDQYTTEAEVKAIVDKVVVDAVDGDTLEGLTNLVEYINEHGGEAAEMAKAIDALEDRADAYEATPAYDITTTQISNWDNEVGAKAIAESKRTEAEVNAQIDAKIEAYGFGTMSKESASNYYTKTEADAAFTDATEVDAQIDAKITAQGFGTMAKKAASDYYTKDDVDGLVDGIEQAIEELPDVTVSEGAGISVAKTDDNYAVSLKAITKNDTTAEAKVQVAKGSISFDAVTGVTYDEYGRVTGIEKTPVTVVDTDTHNKLDSIEASVGVADNTATVTHTVTMTDGETDDAIFAIKGNYTAADGGIQITNSGNNIQIDMVWGTF